MRKYSPIILAFLLISIFLHVIFSNDFLRAEAIPVNFSPGYEAGRFEASWITTWLNGYSPNLETLHEYYAWSYWTTFTLLIIYIFAAGFEYCIAYKLQKK